MIVYLQKKIKNKRDKDSSNNWSRGNEEKTSGVNNDYWVICNV